MNSGSFDGGLLNLTSWVGNAVMPILAALILAMGIYKYSRGYHIDPYIGGTLAALSVSGLLRLAEVFASQGSGTTQYWSAILSLANWVGNVILPVYGGIEIVRAVLGVGEGEEALEQPFDLVELAAEPVGERADVRGQRPWFGHRHVE